MHRTSSKNVQDSFGPRLRRSKNFGVPSKGISGADKKLPGLGLGQSLGKFISYSILRLDGLKLMLLFSYD